MFSLSSDKAKVKAKFFNSNFRFNTIYSVNKHLVIIRYLCDMAIANFKQYEFIRARKFVYLLGVLMPEIKFLYALELVMYKKMLNKFVFAKQERSCHLELHHQ